MRSITRQDNNSVKAETETTNNDFKPDIFGAQFAPEIEVRAETKPKQVTYGDVKLVAEVRGSDACGFIAYLFQFSRGNSICCRCCQHADLDVRVFRLDFLSKMRGATLVPTWSKKGGGERQIGSPLIIHVSTFSKMVCMYQIPSTKKRAVSRLPVEIFNKSFRK